MNKLLVMNWNELVDVNDTVFVLGDFAMGQISETLPIAGRLNGKKILVAGNHDRCWKGARQKDKDRWLPEYKKYFVEVLNHVDMYFGEYDLSLSLNHFPFTGDSHEGDRYVSERPKDDGQILLHGHVHDMWRLNGRQLNVGCDVWNYVPISLNTVFSTLEAGGLYV
jgi:calcineurin-like phosphoesterase family protein